mmetsp:Transcript_11432/g.25923  ORF Transcript_11432/g.25923 Transcript_11432/m.25923 type:complete len:161 (+) Transcript_11432:107-589(+)
MADSTIVVGSSDEERPSKEVQHPSTHGRSRRDPSKKGKRRKRGKSSSSSSSHSSSSGSSRKHSKRRRKEELPKEAKAALKAARKLAKPAKLNSDLGTAAVPYWLAKPRVMGLDFVSGGQETPGRRDGGLGNMLTQGLCYDFTKGRCDRENCRFQHTSKPS